ncbi:hypothetical protein SAMN04487955_105143 [Halomonas korlensis]|uniref:Uncharacterized protein n=1 Tax=Halomonas korlensis TaxID=463301 RepID=A0A1I7HWY0_9GAMM|nr:hypothetical protein SAMN04487955_105143 [Halomonas korlensis]
MCHERHGLHQRDSPLLLRLGSGFLLWFGLISRLGPLFPFDAGTSCYVRVAGHSRTVVIFAFWRATLLALLLFPVAITLLGFFTGTAGSVTVFHGSFIGFAVVTLLAFLFGTIIGKRQGGSRQAEYYANDSYPFEKLSRHHL